MVNYRGTSWKSSMRVVMGEPMVGGLLHPEPYTKEIAKAEQISMSQGSWNSSATH